jgi:hypothetical protein
MKIALWPGTLGYRDFQRKGRRWQGKESVI